MATDPDHAARQLSRWRLAQILSHPNLLRVFDAGRCRLGGAEMIFGVLEYADENLAEILRQRALTIEETRLVLEPALDALAYLHGQGLVHGGLTPANVMAMGDQIKLAIDSISPAKEAAPAKERQDAYDAPEVASGARSGASDVWSLGMLLSEALTRRLPSPNGAKSASDPRLPDNFPAPFLEIVRGCLRRDPDLRWTVAGITAWLHPEASQETVPVTAVVAQKTVATEKAVPEPGISVTKPAPLKSPAQESVPRKSAVPATNPVAHGSLVEVEATPRKAAATTPAAAAAPIVPDPAANPRIPVGDVRRAPAANATKSAGSSLDFLSWTVPLLRRFAVPAIVAIVALAALYAGLGLLRREERPAAPTLVPPVQSESTQAPQQKPKPGSRRSETKPSPRVSTSNSGNNSRTATAPVPAVTNPDSSGHDLGVVQQVLPQASASALATIQGTIRVSVKVIVDAAGNSTGAELVNPGPSAYFARLSQQAAQGWKFAPAQSGRVFLLHFEFTNSGINASATRAGD